MAKGQLFLIGLGLYNEQSPSLEALETMRSCTTLFAEFYTGLMAGLDRKRLEELAGGPIEVLKREDVESRAERIIEATAKGDVGFLVQGDPMVATTHPDLRLRAHAEGVTTRVVHGTSIYSAVGVTGLQLVRFGKAGSVPFPHPSYLPTSPLEVVHQNIERDCHTLLVMDIVADEARYMTANEGMDTLLAMERLLAERRGGPPQDGAPLIDGDSLMIALARAGSPEPVVRAGPLRMLREEDLGPPPHLLVVPAKLHYMEAAYLHAFAGLPAELVPDEG